MYCIRHAGKTNTFLRILLFVTFIVIKNWDSNLNAQFPINIQFSPVSADGLSTDFIRFIYQDREGFIWVCTMNGLKRYEGNSTKIFTHDPANRNSLAGNDVWSITETRDGNFWIGTDGGLTYFEPSQLRFTNYYHDPANANSLACQLVEIVIVDDQNILWIGSHCGLQKFDPATKTFSLMPLATEDELKLDPNSQNAVCLFEDRQDQLWVSAGGDLLLIDKKSFSYKKIIDRKIWGAGVTSIFQDSQDQYWLTTWGKGLAKFNGISPPSDKMLYGDRHILFRSTEWEDLNEEKYLIITLGYRLAVYSYTQDTLYLLKKNTNLAGYFDINNSNEIITDNRNNVWIGTSNGLVLIEPQKQFLEKHYLQPEPTGGYDIHAGTPWHITWNKPFYWSGIWANKGLIQMDSNWNTIKSYPKIPPDINYEKLTQSVFDIYPQSEDTLWLSSDIGMIRFIPLSNQYKTFRPDDINPDLFNFREIIELDNSRILIRTWHEGLYLFNISTNTFLQHFNKENFPGLVSNGITDICQDKQKSIWITTDQGLSWMDPVTNSIHEIDAFPITDECPVQNNICHCATVDSRDHVWIGHQNGLSKWSSDHTLLGNYTTLDGLCNNAIHEVIADANDNIWMITPEGLSVFIQKENRIQNYYINDGLPEKRIMGVLDTDRNGNIVATSNGVIVKVNPQLIYRENSPSKLLITEVVSSNQPQPILKNSLGQKFFKTNYRDNALEVSFAVLNYNSPEKNTFYYRLENTENFWHKSDHGMATYNRLPPGKYLLHVKGSNNYGIMDETGDFLHIEITPEWYQTLVFKILAALTILTLLFLSIRSAYQYRLTQMRRVEAMRTRISKDLHDHIGSTLSSISFSSSAASSMPSVKHEEIKSTLHHISEDARSAMENMSDIVWAINPVNESFRSLIERLKLFGTKMLNNRNTSLTMDIPEAILALPLSIEQRKNIYLILREAIHNTAKYAQATHCTVTARLIEHKLNLRVADDGIGFDSVQPSLGGNGLLNMQHRAEEIQGSLHIQSVPGKGTIINLYIPYS